MVGFKNIPLRFKALFDVKDHNEAHISAIYAAQTGLLNFLECQWLSPVGALLQDAVDSHVGVSWLGTIVKKRCKELIDVSANAELVSQTALSNRDYTFFGRGSHCRQIEDAIGYNPYLPVDSLAKEITKADKLTADALRGQRTTNTPPGNPIIGCIAAV